MRPTWAIAGRTSCSQARGEHIYWWRAVWAGDASRSRGEFALRLRMARGGGICEMGEGTHRHEKRRGEARRRMRRIGGAERGCRATLTQDEQRRRRRRERRRQGIAEDARGCKQGYRRGLAHTRWLGKSVRMEADAGVGGAWMCMNGGAVQLHLGGR